MRSPALKVLLVMFTAAGWSPSAIASPPPWRRAVLVELFTSQGCSSCPPADAFVRELPALGLRQDKVVPLTFHVDYWDALGWKDPFATPAFTERQKSYARSGHLRSPQGEAGINGIYTPQMIVDGQVHLSGQRRQDAMREMERAGIHAATFDLALGATIQQSNIDVVVTALAREHAKPEADWRILVALAATKTRTEVAHGENAGETLYEAAVVRALSDSIPLPRNHETPITVRLKKPNDLPWSGVEVVVFVQSKVTGAVGAVSVLDPKTFIVR